MNDAQSRGRLGGDEMELLSDATVSPGEVARVRLGASTATGSDELQRLARDPSVTVRAVLAINPAAPPQANETLARDTDERVRLLLARKLAALAPSLSAVDQAKLHRETWETLTALVADEAVRVRTTIAEAVKDMPTAPRELILRLARDTAMSVSEPVVRFSPLLTTDDLLALLAEAPPAGIALAVARRSHLDEAVSDAIAASAGNAAIRALLANSSAQIREATLDALIARAVEHTDWHEPLVRRPSLPPRAARMLSEIVATHLLEVLATRADLAPAVAEELRCRLVARLQPDAKAPADAVEPTAEQALALARALAERGKLAEEAVPGGSTPRGSPICHGIAGGGGRHLGFRSGSRRISAQCEGAGEPRLESGLHHAFGRRAAKSAGASGTRCCNQRRSVRQLPTGRRGDALAA